LSIGNPTHVQAGKEKRFWPPGAGVQQKKNKPLRKGERAEGVQRLEGKKKPHQGGKV